MIAKQMNVMVNECLHTFLSYDSYSDGGYRFLEYNLRVKCDIIYGSCSEFQT